MQLYSNLPSSELPPRDLKPKKHYRRNSSGLLHHQEGPAYNPYVVNKLHRSID